MFPCLLQLCALRPISAASLARPIGLNFECTTNGQIRHATSKGLYAAFLSALRMIGLLRQVGVYVHGLWRRGMIHSSELSGLVLFFLIRRAHFHYYAFTPNCLEF